MAKTKGAKKPTKAAKTKGATPAKKHAIPPNTPVIPCQDPLVGQEFDYTDCKPDGTVTKGGKPRRKCTKTRMVVVGCATPPEGSKKANLFAVQKGVRHTVPDSKIRSEMRKMGKGSGNATRADLFVAPAPPAGR